MVMPSDYDYKLTKQIMLNTATMNPDFRPLANFIDATFNVRTVNVIYDCIGKTNQPRLTICFEFESEKEPFYDNREGLYFDRKKQKIIADQFKILVFEQSNCKEKRFFNFFNKQKAPKYKLENILIVYSAFAPIAKIEANQKITPPQLTLLKSQIDNPDIWEISSGFSGVTFFVYSDEQLKKYENSEQRKYWANQYFNLLAPNNEFGYYQRDSFSIYLDSKENFDKNFQSNWYYYYK